MLKNYDYSLDNETSFYERILNQTPNLIFQLTITPENKFFFSFLNRSIKAFFDFSKAELESSPRDIIRSVIHPQDLNIFMKSLQVSKKQFTPWACEFRVCLKNGNIVWLKLNANIEKEACGTAIFYANLTDITSIKAKEIKAQESETRYQFALESSKKGIWDYNLLTDEVIFSKESLEILSLDEKDQMDTNSKWDSRIHPEDFSIYSNSFQLHKEGQTPFFENTKRVLSKDGTYKWITSKGKIIARDEKGNPLRVIGLHTDVTAEKNNEKELIENLKIIQTQNDKLLNFAHIVSHNLRSHTSNFKMLLNLIDEAEDHENTAECYRYLKTTSNALSETIDHLKELVDIQSTVVHKKEDLNVSSFLNMTLEVLSKEIQGNKVKIVNNIGKKATVKFNPAYLESLFLNLTTNAIRYSHPGRAPEICYTLVKRKSKVELLIQDNGLGINLNKYGEKLFGMYKTFHGNQDARGIGLFITKNQIESMGGTIEVESKVNVGTTFKIKFNEEV